jgi:hypothetical protein
LDRGHSGKNKAKAVVRKVAQPHEHIIPSSQTVHNRVTEDDHNASGFGGSKAPNRMGR